MRQFQSKALLIFAIFLFSFSNPALASGVLWIGAHPDDEIYVAPVLADLCVRQGMKCTLLVITDGGKGHCLLPGGCLPTVAAVRAKEMANAATYYRASLTMANLEDSPAGSPDGVLWAWNNSIGGGTVLVDALTAYIRTLNPDILLTFDPRHGSSCHLDHRAVGELALGAATRAGIPLNSIYTPQNYWVNGLVSPMMAWAGNATIIPGDTAVKTMDASAQWLSISKNLSVHPSQFPKSWIDAFTYTPVANQIQSLLSVQDMNLNDTRYFNLCPFNDKYWPGQAPK